MLSRVLTATRKSMADEAQGLRSSLEHDHLALCLKLLDTHTPQLCGRYPKALEKAFQGQELSESRFCEFPSQRLRLDQLGLMDDVQVKQSVEIARALQQVLLLAQPALTRFDPHVSALQGRKQVAASRNPMRPEAYLAALQAVMSDMNVPVEVRMTWLQHLPGALGEALSTAYGEWATQLQSQGIASAVNSKVHRPDASPLRAVSASLGAGAGGRLLPQRQTVLTLGCLRRLMAGELEAVLRDPHAAFAHEFSREFEASVVQSSVGHFEATVPAAFEAL